MIVTRFSADQMKIDEMLPKQWQAFINMFAMVLTSFLVMCVVTPVFIILAVPILYFYYRVQQFYKVRKSRELFAKVHFLLQFAACLTIFSKNTIANCLPSFFLPFSRLQGAFPRVETAGLDDEVTDHKHFY
jgi:hypothetical protein